MSLPSLLPPDSQIGMYLAEADVVKRYRASGEPLGPTTGSFKGLTTSIGGYTPPGLFIVHGQPGVGKTAFCAQISAEAGFPAIYVTTEMLPLEMVRRHLARELGIPRDQLLTGDAEAEERIALSGSLDAQTQPWYLVDGCDVAVPVEWLADQVDELKRRYNTPHALVVVDSLQSWAMTSLTGVSSEYEQLNRAMQELRALALDRRIPVWVISERNRQSMQSGGMNAAAGTRRIEYGADLMLSLAQAPRNHDAADPHGEVTVEVHIVKNRFGPAGYAILMGFQGNQMRFRELDLQE